MEIRERMLGLLNQIDKDLANKVANGLGLKVPTEIPLNHQHSPDAEPEGYKSVIKKNKIDKSPALSMANTRKDTIKTRRIAVFAEQGVDIKELESIKNALLQQKAMVKIVSSKLGEIKSDNGTVEIDESILTSASVLYDALVIPNGNNEMKEMLESDKRFGEFLQNSYKHYKAIAVNGLAVDYMKKTLADIYSTDKGIIMDKPIDKFIDAVKQHRFWNR